MQVAKWGNSLAVRIPADVARELGLREGDSVDIQRLGPNLLGVARDQRREKAMETIIRLSRPLPPDYKFDREEANAR